MIKITITGLPTKRDFDQLLIDAKMSAIEEDINQRSMRLSGLVCPTHGTIPDVTCSVNFHDGRIEDNVDVAFSYPTCCDDFGNMINEMLT